MGDYAIFYRCSDNAPYYLVVVIYSWEGVYYCSTDGQYYRFDRYSTVPEGLLLTCGDLSYYGPNCPGGPSFNPAWALYTNTHIL